MDKTRRVDASGKASSTPPGARMSQLVKNLNRSVVLELLRREGPLSRTEIARRAGISLPVASRLIQTLLAENRVVEVGKTGSSGGRRRTLIGYNASYGTVAGVDMGAPETAIAGPDRAGRTRWGRRVPSGQLSASGNWVGGVAAAIERAVHEAGAGPRERGGVGVGVPGIVRRGVIFDPPGLRLSDA